MMPALLGFAVMLALAFARVPIALAMAITGFGGLAILKGINPSMSSVAATLWESGFQITLSVIPLFILMGNFVTKAGMARELYRAAHTFVGHFRGGLAMATILACAGFGAICGSSIATAATMTKVAYPSMKEVGYSDELATGSIAAGGTLGILIPPSTIMVIYGIMTEQSIGALFAAGVIPGAIATLFYLGTAWNCVRRNPSLGPPGERTSWAGRLVALRHIWGVIVLFIIVMGGMYGGLFTPTEAAGVGAMGGFLFALSRGRLTPKILLEVLTESAQMTAMLFTILIGASIFANFVNFTSLPQDLQTFVSQFNVHPMMVVVAICVIYVILGTAMEELSMILLTVPIFFPLIVHLGLDPIWFGVLIVCVVEIGMISPPVGMNIFVISSMLPDVPTSSIWRGVMPFLFADILRLALLIAFPAITLWLPKYLNL